MKFCRYKEKRTEDLRKQSVGGGNLDLNQRENYRTESIAHEGAILSLLFLQYYQSMKRGMG
jgi:hypothetical protein